MSHPHILSPDQDLLPASGLSMSYFDSPLPKPERDLAGKHYASAAILISKNPPNHFTTFLI